MKLHFLGANRQVTGSRYCLEVAGQQILIDCGMFQERTFQGRNWDPCPIPPGELEALLLTHVHIDHSGLIPRLVKEGFHAPIYATRPSAALVEVMLRDAAKIQMEDAAYKRKRHLREGRRGAHEELPLYTDEDVDPVGPLLQPVSYAAATPITEHVTATFHDAGHILGSAMIELEARENGRTQRIVFSGDIGQWNKPLIRDPSLLPRADYVVMESTYGDRLHGQAGDVATQLADVINATTRRGGNVVIPTFAVERAQELMYYIGQLVHADRIPDLPVYLDSPMAVDVTNIYARFPDCFDEETVRLIASDTPPLRFPGLRLIRTADESKLINEVRRPCIIMASSGMCNAGRIKHHLRANISRAECTILFVGFQSPGTLGRIILDGTPRVRIHGQTFDVRARIAQIYGFSGHADRDGLLRWITHFEHPLKRVFLTHGEEHVALEFAKLVEQQTGFPTTVPTYHQVVELN